MARPGPSVWAVITLGVAVAVALPQGQISPRFLTFDAPLELPGVAEPPLQCGTSLVRAIQLGLVTATPLADGEPLSFMQDPPLLTADHVGAFSLRDFLVVGDKDTVQFKRFDPDKTEDNIETWTRSGTRTIGGSVVSVFNPSWPDSELARILRRTSYGWDRPYLYWGQMLVSVPDVASGPAKDEFRNVYLRLRSTNLPASRVVTLNDTVQYSSHVVNLVMPDYGDARVPGGSHEFQEDAVAKKFYEFFEDAYDALAIVPQRTHLANFGAFHSNVRNQVSGLGDRLYDYSAVFGSAGVLQSVEVYPQTALATNSTSNHEIAHQWGNYMNWSRLAGITRAGHQPGSHAPLWHEGESMISAVLAATRRVKRSAALRSFGFFPLDGSEFEIERTPAPIRYHPIELYAMGQLPQERVPNLDIFQNQDQFDASTTATPDPGTKLSGGVKSVSINDILREHGTRSGPSPTEWRRATIVVSRSALLSQSEMDFWNFFSKRIEDPERTGVMSYDGFASFDATTDNAVDLKTDVSPRDGEKVTTDIPVSFPQFGTRDVRGVEFDNPVPSRYKAGERVTLSGRVTATDRADFHALLLYFYKYGGTSEETVRFDVSVTGNRFRADVQFTDAQASMYQMSVYLFWPGSGSQAPRGTLRPVRVE